MKKVILLVCCLFLLSGCLNNSVQKRVASDLTLDKTYVSDDGESTIKLSSDLTYELSDCNAEGCMLYTGKFYVEGRQIILEQEKYSSTGEEKDLIDSENTIIYDINSKDSFDKFKIK